MERWRFELLGTPRAIRGETVVTRLRSRLAWAVLASLLLEKGPHQRDDLARRFWPDSEHRAARKSLREALFSIRQTLGTGTLDEDRESVAWIAPFTADVAELDAGDPIEVRGLFLDGVDDPAGFGWIERTRAHLRQRCIQALQKEAQRRFKSGERDAAGQTALDLLGLDPDDEVGKAISLETLSHVTRRRLAETLTWEEAIQVVGDADALPPREERALETLIARQLAMLSETDRRGALALAIFPCAFTPEQAAQIAHVDAPTLERLARSCLIAPDLRGFVMRPAIRQALWRRLTGAQRARLHQRHSAHFLHRLVTVPSPTDPYSPDWRRQVRTELENHLHALNWHLSEPPSSAGIDWIEGLNQWWSAGIFPEGYRHLRRAIPYLEEAVRTLGPRYAGYAALLRAHFSMEAREFADALPWSRQGLALWQPLRNEVDLNWAYHQLLDIAHHAGDDETFDAVAPQALADGSWERPGGPERVVFLIAENYMARRRFDEALEYNNRCFSLRAERGQRREEQPGLWYQRAVILRGLGRDDEAERDWDRAVTGFEAAHNRHGAAECYLQLGELAARRGQTGLGLSLVTHAITIFQELGNPDAVAAANASLSDVHCLRGESETARALLNEGLAYWEANGHPRWIERFQERLRQLEVLNDKGNTSHDKE